MNYLYTGKIVIQRKTIKQLLTCAYELDVKQLMVKISADLIDTIKKTDYLFVFEIARKFKLTALYYRTLWQICSNFNEQIQLKYFLKLSFYTFYELISKNDPTIVADRNETLLLKQIMLWIFCNSAILNDNTRENDRKPIIEMILNEINYSKIDLNDLHRIIAEHNFVFKEVPECLHFFKNIFK